MDRFSSTLTYREQGKAVRWAASLGMLLRFSKRKPLGAIGAFIVLLLMLVAMVGPWIAVKDPIQVHPADRLQGPSANYYFGTDEMGRDIFARIVLGARISLFIGFGAIVVSTVLSTVVGVISAYVEGLFDQILQRFVDAMMAFPFIIFMVMMMSVLGVGIVNLIIVLGIRMAAGTSRVVRGAALSIKENQYVDAAKAIGCSPQQIMAKHILPNLFAPIMILATVGIGQAILVESSLSFLGLGVPPPYPSWGRTLSDSGMRFLLINPWIAIFPGVAISLAVYGISMLGDALRDVLDPRLRGIGR